MKLERIDEKTVKCYLSNEDLEEYDIDYKDFLIRSEKARSVMQDIIHQASEELGYVPPKFAFDLQIMMLPDQGLMLILSEKEPADLKDSAQFMDYLKEMRKNIQKIQEDAVQDGENKGNFVAEDSEKHFAESFEKNQKISKKNKKKAATEKKPEQAIFVFDSMQRVLALAKSIPKDVKVKSTLYSMQDQYYLYLHKGKASYAKYSKVCIQAMEFGQVHSVQEDSMSYIEEHGQCIIMKNALKKMHL